MFVAPRVAIAPWSSIGGIFSVRDSRFHVSPKNPMSEVAMPLVWFTRIARGQRTVYRLINGWLSRPALRKFLSLEFYVFRFLGLVIRTSQYQNGPKRISCYFPDFHAKPLTYHRSSTAPVDNSWFRLLIQLVTSQFLREPSRLSTFGAPEKPNDINRQAISP